VAKSRTKVYEDVHTMAFWMMPQSDGHFVILGMAGTGLLPPGKRRL
jgi:hypothetical protein